MHESRCNIAYLEKSRIEIHNVTLPRLTMVLHAFQLTHVVTSLYYSTAFIRQTSGNLIDHFESSQSNGCLMNITNWPLRVETTCGRITPWLSIPVVRALAQPSLLTVDSKVTLGKPLKVRVPLGDYFAHQELNILIDHLNAEISGKNLIHS